MRIWNAPPSQHCVAAGLIDDKKGHEQGAVVVSSDGGSHWSQYEVKERPVSLFFLNDSLGWMVTDRGLWSTVEGGRAWIKVQSRKGHPADLVPRRRITATSSGLKGLAQETTDGGKTWVQLEASEKAPDAQLLNYDISLVSRHARHHRGRARRIRAGSLESELGS